MSDSYTDVEACVQAALASILSDTISNIAALMREYTVPHHNFERATKNERIDQIVKKMIAYSLMIKN
jgi:hypothetical protein